MILVVESKPRVKRDAKESFNDRGYKGTLELKRPPGAKFSTTPTHSQIYVVQQRLRKEKSLHFVRGRLVGVPGALCAVEQPNEKGKNW